MTKTVLKTLNFFMYFKSSTFSVSTKYQYINVLGVFQLVYFSFEDIFPKIIQMDNDQRKEEIQRHFLLPIFVSVLLPSY